MKNTFFLSLIQTNFNVVANTLENPIPIEEYHLSRKHTQIASQILFTWVNFFSVFCFSYPIGIEPDGTTSMSWDPCRQTTLCHACCLKFLLTIRLIQITDPKHHEIMFIVIHIRGMKNILCNVISLCLQ